MARIQLKNTSIFIEDGLSGTSQVDVPNSALNPTPVVETTKGVNPGTDEVQTIRQYRNNPTGGTFTLSFDVNGGETFTTAGIAYNAPAATIEAAIDTAATGVVTGWTNGDISVSGGDLTTADVTLTFDGLSVDQFDHALTTINGDSLTGVDIALETVLAIDTTVLNTDDTDLVPVGARFTVAGETGSPVHTVTARSTQVAGLTEFITFTPALVGAAPADNAVITYLPQRIEIKIGEGDLTWTETTERIYDLDRNTLDTVRDGPQTPLEMETSFIFEFIKTESGQTITPVDALKRKGEASEWVSSATDKCEPYAVNWRVVNCVDCGTDQDEEFLFPDFRHDTLEFSIQDATVSVTGRCNAIEPTITRSNNSVCS